MGIEDTFLVGANGAEKANPSPKGDLASVDVRKTDRQAAMSNRMSRPCGAVFRQVVWGDISTEAKCLVILDARTLQEYGSSHLKGSINLNLKIVLSFRGQIARLDRDKAYLLYCRTGCRSARVLLLMMFLGFGGRYNLTNGIEQWKREGCEVVLDSGR